MGKNKKCIVCICLILAAILLLAGCVERFVGEDTVYSTGDVLTPEMIESIFEAVATPVTEKYPTETLEDGSLLLYWLEGGTVWHVSLNCGSIAKSSPENVRSGDIAAAISSGKERGCMICTEELELDTEERTETANRIEKAETIMFEKYPKDYDSSGNLIVYWLKNGSVWHVSAKCSSLLKSSESDIISGSECDAKASGKERACKKCTENN